MYQIKWIDSDGNEKSFCCESAMDLLTVMGRCQENNYSHEWLKI